MTIAEEFEKARHGRFMANTGDKMRRLRAQVGRDYRLRFEDREGEVHAVCAGCLQTVAKLTVGGGGYTYSCSELLTMHVAHMTLCHGVELTYEHYGEDYA